MASYKPNVKNAAMFGEEKKGYAKEKVDSYILRTESTYQKATEAIAELKTACEEKDNQIAALKAMIDNLNSAASAPAVQPEVQTPSYEPTPVVDNSRIDELESKYNSVKADKVELQSLVNQLKRENTDLISESEVLRNSNSQLKVKVDTLSADLTSTRDSSEKEDERQKELLAKVLIDARVAAEKIVEDAKTEASSIRIDSQVQIAKLEEQQDKLLNQISETYRNFKDFAQSVETINRKD